MVVELGQNSITTKLFHSPETRCVPPLIPEFPFGLPSLWNTCSPQIIRHFSAMLLDSWLWMSKSLHDFEYFHLSFDARFPVFYGPTLKTIRSRNVEILLKLETNQKHMSSFSWTLHFNIIVCLYIYCVSIINNEKNNK